MRNTLFKLGLFGTGVVSGWILACFVLPQYSSRTRGKDPDARRLPGQPDIRGLINQSSNGVLDRPRPDNPPANVPHNLSRQRVAMIDSSERNHF